VKALVIDWIRMVASWMTQAAALPGFGKR